MDERMIDIELCEYVELLQVKFCYYSLLNYMANKDNRYSTISVDKEFLKSIDPLNYASMERTWNEV